MSVYKDRRYENPSTVMLVINMRHAGLVQVVLVCVHLLICFICYFKSRRNVLKKNGHPS